MSARPWVERTIVPGAKRKSVELFAYLPDDEEQARAWLKKVLGSRVQLERVQHRGVTVWKLSAEHLLRLVGAMAYAYGPTKMRLEVLHARKCDWKCKKAKVTSAWKCVCKCAGEFHGGKGDRNDWYPAGGSTIVYYDKTRIDQLIIAEGQFPADRKVPRPVPPPAATPVLAVEPPAYRPVPLPPARPAPEPAPVSPPPRTAVPMSSRSNTPPHRPGPATPRPALRSAHPVAVKMRRPVARPLAAVLALVAISGGVWLGSRPDTPSEQQVTDRGTVQPAPPPPERQLPPPPPAEQPAPEPRLPAGCFPFQSGC